MVHDDAASRPSAAQALAEIKSVVDETTPKALLVSPSYIHPDTGWTEQDIYSM